MKCVTQTWIISQVFVCNVLSSFNEYLKKQAVKAELFQNTAHFFQSPVTLLIIKRTDTVQRASNIKNTHKTGREGAHQKPVGYFSCVCTDSAKTINVCERVHQKEKTNGFERLHLYKSNAAALV